METCKLVVQENSLHRREEQTNVHVRAYIVPLLDLQMSKRMLNITIIVARFYTFRVFLVGDRTSRIVLLFFLRANEK